MNQQQKADTVAELRAVLARAASVIVTEFRGLTVEEATKLRREIRSADCQHRVVKNTLFRRAVADTKMAALAPLFKGPCSITFSLSDPVAPAKVIDKFVEGQEHLKVKGGYLDGQVLDQANVKTLARMKGKDELRAELLMALLAPAQSLLRVLGAAPQTFLYALRAREDSLGGTTT